MNADPVHTIRLSSYAEPGRDGRKRLEWKTIMTFLRSHPYEEIANTAKRELLFSIDGFDYLNPDGLIWLLLLGDQLKQRGNSIWLEFPTDSRQLSYLKGCNFHNVALENYSISNMYCLDEIAASRLHEGMKFSRVNLSTLTDLANKVARLFSTPEFLHDVGLQDADETVAEFLPPFLRTIQETTKNIVQHSNEMPDTGSGYFVMNPLGRRRIRICVGDAGRGFMSSLGSKKVSVKSDLDAITSALLFRFTHARPGGEGLFRVVQFVGRSGGVLRIHSGKGEAFLKVPRMTQSDSIDLDAKRLIETGLRSPRSITFQGVQLQIDFGEEH